MRLPAFSDVLTLAAILGIGGSVVLLRGQPDRVLRLAERSARSAEDPPAPAERLSDYERAPWEACAVPSPAGTGTNGMGGSPPRPGFALRFGDESGTYRLMSTFLLPGDRLEIEVVLPDPGARYVASVDGGSLAQGGPESWVYTAPDETGVHRIEVRERGSGEAICLKALVLVPYDGETVFRGYRIGSYESIPLRNDPAYSRPEGLFRVTGINEDTWLTPHFQLKQFVCKQAADGSRFLIVGPRLLLKLEAILEELNQRGVEAETLFVMSGYRTPFYNRAIGNRTRYSRHVYGDAADIFVDQDRDGMMDDLDGDGEITRADATVLADVVENMTDESWYRPLVGGLGIYGPAPHRGPFVHVDTRGTPARW